MDGGNGRDEYGPMISEIREWLVRIDTNQSHQTKLLEAMSEQAKDTYNKADRAEDKAESALKLAEKNEKRIDEREREENVNRRWVIGTILTIITILLALLPIFVSYYGA